MDPVVKNRLWKPEFHFSPPQGWLNDPNGLIQYKGQYHLFYQHNPDSCDWSSMHWGHAVSGDLIHWRDQPIALYPDKEYDKSVRGGCFSGSAVEADGEMALFYTGCVPEHAIPQTQNIAYSSDGVHFEKYDGNPVISTPPGGYAPCEFRDPKVLRHEGVWYMVVGAATAPSEQGGEGAILLYRSSDGKQWDYVSAIFRSGEKYGSMFECPDLFWLSGKWVLQFSPMYHKEYRTSVYLVGEMDFEKGVFTPEYEGVSDYGMDYYAPQSFEDESGRRIVIAWISEQTWMPWFTTYGPTESENWRGAMTLPRECRLSEKGGLCFALVSEFESLRGPARAHQEITLTQEPLEIPEAKDNVYEMVLEAGVSGLGNGMQIILMQGGGNQAVLTVDPHSDRLIFNRDQAGNGLSGRVECPLGAGVGKIHLQIIVDRSTLEVFVNKGEHCLTSFLFPEKGQDGVAVCSVDGTSFVERITVYELKKDREAF